MNNLRRKKNEYIYVYFNNVVFLLLFVSRFYELKIKMRATLI